MILTDGEIADLAHQGMIAPYIPQLVTADVISYGQSSMGYDMRLDTEFVLFADIPGQILDPKRDNPNTYERLYRAAPFLLPPHGYLLGVSVERFQIPADVMGLVIGKSSYARKGLIVNATPMEPGWSGYLTIELANATHLPIQIYPGEGIAQAVFFRAAQAPRTTYGSRKYQNQPHRPIVGGLYAPE